MRLTWNYYSGIVAPVMTMTAIVILFVFADKQPGISMYFFPFVLLGLIMLSVMILVLVSMLKLISDLVPFDIFKYKTDKIYWLISIWALIELIHHFFYKLIHDKKHSLIEIINEERYKDLTLPLGGAIGIALKKLKNFRQSSKGAPSLTQGKSSSNGA